MQGSLYFWALRRLYLSVPGRRRTLSRFICKVNNVPGSTVLDKAAKLEKRGIITSEERAAIRTIYAHDRNTFHHLTEDIETDNKKLGERARDCVNALYQVESEIFAHTVREGTVVVKHPEYWKPMMS